MVIQPFYKRLGFRVSLITMLGTFIIGLSLYFVLYINEYGAMIGNIRERSEYVHHYLSVELTPISFLTICTVADETGAAYASASRDMRNVRRIAGLNRLYTCKTCPDGSLVYVVDGLDAEDPGFRHAGDPVEAGLSEKLSHCLSGQTIIDSDITKTESGYVLASYWPFYGEEGDVIGAVGMEYDCSSEYSTFRNIRIYAIVILVITAIGVLIISHFLMAKLSDPFFRKLAYTDFLTGLRNRTAFETDIQEYELVKDELESVTFFVFDLNELKQVNDRHGHAAGDQYIRIAAEQIHNAVSVYGDPYRIGGDEFAAILIDLNPEALDKVEAVFLEGQRCPEFKSVKFTPSVSFGRATYRPEVHRNLHDVFREADGYMYDMKREHKAEYGQDPGSQKKL